MEEGQPQVHNPGLVQGQNIGHYQQITQYLDSTGREPVASTQPEHIWLVPYQHNPFFTGREEVLNQLHEHFTRAQAAALTQPPAITGLGGIGKTQIAIEYAYRHRDEYKHVLWVNASEPVTLTDGFVQIARALQLPIKDEQDQNIVVKVVKQWLINSDGWLLILDNADDLSLAYTFLPATGNGHVLLTTREHKTGRIARGFEVKQMEREEGVLFLLRRSKVLASPDAPLTQAKETDQQVAADIVKELDGLPLALDQAGAYIEEMECDLPTYLQRYRQNQHQFELLKRRGRLETDYPNAVAITWSLNFHQVEQKSSIAADLLRFFAFLAPEAIPEELIVTGANELGPHLQLITADAMLLNEAIDVLRRFSLVWRNTSERTLSIHRLVQAVLIEGMSQERRRQWAERAVRAVNHKYPRDEEAPWSLSEQYLPHVLTLIAFFNQWERGFSEVAELFHKAGIYLVNRGQFEQAESLLQRGLAIREQILGENHPDTAQSLNHLGILYRDRGKFDEAELFYQRALTIREQVLGVDHPDTATSFNNLATLYRDRGKYKEAELLYQRALADKEQVLGPNHPSIANTLHMFALLFYNQQKYTEAELHLRRALAIYEQTMGTNDPYTANVLRSLANLYRDRGEYEQAESLYLRVLAIKEQTMGTDHADTAQALNNLAVLYHRQHKYEQAEQLLQRALAIRETALGVNHTHVAQTLSNLGNLYYGQGKYEQAEPLFQRAIAIREKAGVVDPYAAGTLSNLARLYHDQGKYEQANPLYQRAIDIYEQKLGPEHDTTIKTREELESLLRNMDKAHHDDNTLLDGIQ